MTLILGTVGGVLLGLFVEIAAEGGHPAMAALTLITGVMLCIESRRP